MLIGDNTANNVIGASRLLPEKIEYDTKDKKKVYTATDTLLIDTYNKFASNET